MTQNKPQGALRPDIAAGDRQEGAMENGHPSVFKGLQDGTDRGEEGATADREQGDASQVQKDMDEAGTGEYISREAAGPDLEKRRREAEKNVSQSTENPSTGRSEER